MKRRIKMIIKIMKDEVEPWQRLNGYAGAGCGKVLEVKRLVCKFVQMGEQEGRRHLKS